MKKNIILVLSILSLMLLSACGEKTEKKDQKNKGLKVGLVLNLGGLGDKSFNDSAYAGLVRAKDELGIDFKYVEPGTLADFDTFLVEFAEANYDLVIALGHDMNDPVSKVAADYPDIKFAIVDTVVDLDNVTSIVFNEQEGSFLAGYMASLASQTKKLGFIGAMDIPSINNFYKGYKQGALYADADTDIINLYVGGGKPFNDPAKAKELSISLYNNDVDVVYAAAGGSGRGMLEAVKEIKGLYAFGVDSNQDAEVPGKIISSMMKRVDNALYQTVAELQKGTLKSGTEVFGIKEGGVGLTDFAEIKKSNFENLDVLIGKTKEVEAKLLNGEITVK